MPDVSRNQHRWRQSLSDEACRVIDEGAEALAWAWKTDMRDPKSYPMNTSAIFSELVERMEQIRNGDMPQSRQGPIDLSRYRFSPPNRFSELINEKTIKAIYEDQNADSYQDALQRAALGDERAFRKIMRAIDLAFFTNLAGWPPKPRNQFLHRNLLKFGELAGVGDLTPEGMVEFFDDVCPCGEKHKNDAIRKLKKRRERQLGTIPDE